MSGEGERYLPPEEHHHRREYYGDIKLEYGSPWTEHLHFNDWQRKTPYELKQEIVHGKHYQANKRKPGHFKHETEWIKESIVDASRDSKLHDWIFDREGTDIGDIPATLPTEAVNFNFHQG